MSRKHHTPKSNTEPQAKPNAEPSPASCGECKFWREQGIDERVDASVPLGLCTAFPPQIVPLATRFGPRAEYGVTRQTTPACGAAK